MASDDGDTGAAERRHSAAQRHARTTARRDRQIAEIAALVVAGRRDRALGLAFEHAAEFPDDADLLPQLAETVTERGPR
jgi:hypothetical protein